MSIRVHAVGSDNFRYTASAIPLGEVYALASVLSIVSAGPVHRVAGTAADSLASPGSPATQGTAAVAHLTGRRTYEMGVHAILEEAPAPILFVAVRESHVIGPDSGSNLVDLHLRNVTARELTRNLDRVLVSANLNKTGALFAVGTVFNRFRARHPKRAGAPRLTITLSH